MKNKRKLAEIIKYLSKLRDKIDSEVVNAPKIMNPVVYSELYQKSAYLDSRLDTAIENLKEVKNCL